MNPKLLRSPNGDAGTGAPASGAPTTNPPAVPPAAAPGASADAGKGQPPQPHVNHGEFVDYSKRVQKLEDRGRETGDLLQKIAKKLGITDEPAPQSSPQQQQPRTQPDGASGDAAMKRELGLFYAINDAQVTLTKEQREAITTLYRASGYPEDADGFLKKMLPAFGVKVGQPAPTPPQRNVVTNTGAPGSTPAAAAPKLGEASADEVRAAWKDMSREDQLAAWSEFERRHGGRSDRFARRPRK